MNGVLVLSANKYELFIEYINKMVLLVKHLVMCVQNGIKHGIRSLAQHTKRSTLRRKCKTVLTLSVKLIKLLLIESIADMSNLSYAIKQIETFACSLMSK